MNPPVDVTHYFLWAGVVLAGALLGVLDWRRIRRPLGGLLLLAGALGGVALTWISPFDFVTGGWYMQGVILFGGSALALGGYAAAVAVQLLVWLGRRLSPRRPAG